MSPLRKDRLSAVLGESPFSHCIVFHKQTTEHSVQKEVGRFHKKEQSAGKPPKGSSTAVLGHKQAPLERKGGGSGDIQEKGVRVRKPVGKSQFMMELELICGKSAEITPNPVSGTHEPLKPWLSICEMRMTIFQSLGLRSDTLEEGQNDESNFSLIEILCGADQVYSSSFCKQIQPRSLTVLNIYSGWTVTKHLLPFLRIYNCAVGFSISILQYIKTINQVGVKYEEQLVVYASQSQNLKREMTASWKSTGESESVPNLEKKLTALDFENLVYNVASS
ncbi:hypothetical protein STEG23_011870 [Scotinomys teguina]